MNRYKVKRINGKIFQRHRLVFEKHLGRKLIKGEVVHHIDNNRANNELDNLILFPTQEAHARHHYEKGDLKLQAGENKKILINGKLECCKCKEFKVLEKFLTNSQSHLGVKGICRKCYGTQRKNRKS